MTFLESILLGLLQGITEFLPVSSSGHLAIAQHLFSDRANTDLLFETALHLATLFAVVIFFHKRILLIFKAFLGLFFKRYSSCYFESKRFMWGIIVATIPTGIIGLFLEKYATAFFSSTIFVGYGLIITSIILVISDRFQSSGRIDGKKSIIIGVVQGLAVLPGISRSGSTIAASVILGIKREEAAEFSFLISLPAILGATILESKYIDASHIAQLDVYLVGMLVAFVSGLFAIKFMMNIVRKAKLIYFAFYCLALGMTTVIFL